MSQVIGVVGPTGSGKTELAVALAKKFNGVLISADSRQVYRGLDVGSNKEGESGIWHGQAARFVGLIPQLLIDVAEPGSRFTLADWLLLARQAISLIEALSHRPIIVGGTGLYVTALLEGWMPTEEDLTVRRKLEKLTLAQLRSRAEGAGLNRSDRQNRRRLIRAIERQSVPFPKREGLVVPKSLILQTGIDRAEIYRRAEERYQRIFPALQEEIGELLRRGVEISWLKSLGLDYRIACQHYSGEIDQNQALLNYAWAVHAFIRRQETWWRHHGPVIKVASAPEAIALAGRFLEGRNSKPKDQKSKCR